MSVRRLKSSKPEIQKKEDDIKVQMMVETTLQDIEKRRYHTSESELRQVL